MKTFEGKQIRLIRDRDVVIVQSNTTRRIYVKLPITAVDKLPSTAVFTLEPFQYLVCTGRSLRQAGLNKEMDRSDVIVDALVGVPLTNLMKRRVENGILVLLDKAAAEALRDVAHAVEDTVEEERIATEEAAAEENEERNKQRDAEVAAQLAAHEKFVQEQQTETGAPTVSLAEAVALHNADVPPAPVVAPIVDDAPVIDAPPAAETVVVEVAPVAQPMPDLKLVPEPALEPEAKVAKKSRPKKRD